MKALAVTLSYSVLVGLTASLRYVVITLVCVLLHRYYMFIVL